MDAEWRRVKLEVLLERVNRGRVNSLGCDCFYNSLATNCRRRGNNQGPKYGRVKITLPDNTRKVFLAHRFLYMLHTNTLHIPHDKQISHICHNSLCINPLHLSLEEAHVNNETCRLSWLSFWAVEVSHFCCLLHECSLLFLVTLFDMGDHSFPWNIQPRYQFFFFESTSRNSPWRRPVFLCGTRMIFSSSCLLCISPVFFLVVSSPGYLQAGEHQRQHTLGRWISQDHGSSGGWQNRLGAQSSQHR